MGCSNCGAPRHGRAKRCGACQVWFYRHNRTERPESVWIRRNRERLDRQLQARLLRLVELYEDDRSLTA